MYLWRAKVLLATVCTYRELEYTKSGSTKSGPVCTYGELESTKSCPTVCIPMESWSPLNCMYLRRARVHKSGSTVHKSASTYVCTVYLYLYSFQVNVGIVELKRFLGMQASYTVPQLDTWYCTFGSQLWDLRLLIKKSPNFYWVAFSKIQASPALSTHKWSWILCRTPCNFAGSHPLASTLSCSWYFT